MKNSSKSEGQQLVTVSREINNFVAKEELLFILEDGGLVFPPAPWRAPRPSRTEPPAPQPPVPRCSARLHARAPAPLPSAAPAPRPVPAAIAASRPPGPRRSDRLHVVLVFPPPVLSTRVSPPVATILLRRTSVVLFDALSAVLAHALRPPPRPMIVFLLLSAAVSPSDLGPVLSLSSSLLMLP